MTERTRNIAVGLTAIAGLLAIGAMLILFGYLPQWMAKGYDLRVELAHAAGLRHGSRVTYNGIDVGQVTRIDLIPPPGAGVVLVARIEEGVLLPQGVKAAVSDRLFGGSPTLSLLWTPTAPTEQVQTLATDGSAIIHGEAQSLSGSLVGQLSEQLAEPMQQLKRVSENFEQLSRQWTEVGRNVNKLVEPRAPGDVDAGEEAGNLASMVARADARMAELRDVMDNMNRTLQGVQSWVEDEALRSDVSATVANARKLTANLNEQVQVLSQRYVAVADDMTQALKTLNETVELARSGEGTVGKLLHDPALYNNLNDAGERLNLALDEMNLLLEKLRHEGLPVQFGK